MNNIFIYKYIYIYENKGYAIEYIYTCFIKVGVQGAKKTYIRRGVRVEPEKKKKSSRAGTNLKSKSNHQPFREPLVNRQLCCLRVGSGDGRRSSEALGCFSNTWPRHGLNRIGRYTRYPSVCGRARLVFSYMNRLQPVFLAPCGFPCIPKEMYLCQWQQERSKEYRLLGLFF